MVPLIEHRDGNSENLNTETLDTESPIQDWGSSSHGHIGNGIDFSFEELSEGGAELAVEGGAADLEQEIGAAAGPSHLLRFVHAAVDQEVSRTFGERCADPQTGTMAFGIV